MNKFTEDFHQASFPGVSLTSTEKEILEDFWSTDDIPFVDININYDYTSTYQWLKENDHLFTEVRSQKQERIKQTQYHQEWYAVKRAEDWNCLYIKGSPYKDYNIVQTTETNTEDVKLETVEGAAKDLVKCFEDNDLPLMRLWIFRLGPGGWLQPHRDAIVEKTPPLAQFWMPLHEFPSSLKIYPHGYLPHQVGHLYLFNNQHFFHSVINPTDEYRYVAVGEIDFNTISKEKTDYISNLAINQWV